MTEAARGGRRGRTREKGGGGRARRMEGGVR